MAKDKGDANEGSELRRRAEELLRSKRAEARPQRTDAKSQRLLHELEVHQIELEMQNAELRKSRDELEATLGKCTDLYDFAPVGYFTLDRDGVIRAANLTGAAILRVERSLLPGRRFDSFLSPEVRLNFIPFLERVFSSMIKETCEASLKKDGKRPLHLQIEAVASASVTECRLAVIDISGRREMEEKLKIMHSELEAHASELEAANIELEAFNYMVAHDLRTPLSSINGFCQVIQKLFNGQNADCRKYLQEIYEASLRMDRLIDALLVFSRVSRVKIHHEKVALGKMALEAATGLNMAEPERRVTFRISEGIVANGDASLLRIVIDNLIGNAWKYSEKREEAVIEFGVSESEREQIFFVRDNGSGFDNANAEKLFVPFERLPGSNEFKGHGIGLATVERIIRRHGGRVWAEGEPGKGATFYFTLTAAGDSN